MLFVLILVLLFSYAYWIYRPRKKMDLPPVCPTSWPIIGCVHEFLGKEDNSKDFLKLICRYAEYCEQNNGVIHSFMGPYLVFCVTDPDDSVTILSTCLEKNWAYEFARSWVGDGLVTVTSNLELWKRHRRIITRSFNQQVLDGYISIFNKRALWLAKKLSAKVDTGPFEHYHLLEDISMGTMYQTTMEFTEKDIGSIDGQELKEAIKSMIKIVNQRFQNVLLMIPFIYKFTSIKREEEYQQAALHRISSEVIKRKRSAIQNKEKTPAKFKSFLELLLELPDEEAFPEKEIQDEVETMITAGTDTLATTLAFCMILLGAHQDIQDKLYEEIKEVCGTSNSDVTKQHLSKLDFMEAVLLETLRLYPILPATLRYASTDVKLRNCTLPAGTTVILLLYSIHRSTKQWGADAGEFVPQRWLPVPPPAARAFAGFSIGKRGCIGKAYAMMSMKITLVTVLRHFRISADITKLKVKAMAFLKPASGCEISLQPREHK